MNHNEQQQMQPINNQTNKFNTQITEEKSHLTIQSPQLKVIQTSQLVITTEDILKFKGSSESLTYVLGFCALNALFSFIEIGTLIQSLTGAGISLSPNLSATVAFLFISYVLIFSSFIILLIARLKMHIILILTSLVIIIVSGGFFLIGLICDFNYVSEFLDKLDGSLRSTFISLIVESILYFICYYTMLISLSVRVAIFLALDMNKPNFFANYAIKIKNKLGKNKINP